MNQIREILESNQDDALAFIDEFKMNLTTSDVFVFTPNGDMITLPKGATILDFAFRIHTKIGSQCIGGKVNHKLVPLSYQLNSGDQIQIITSRKQMPKEDWVNYVVTAHARQKIKHSLKEVERAKSIEGKELFKKWAKKKGMLFIEANILSLYRKLKYDSAQEMYFLISNGTLVLDSITGYELKQGKILWEKGAPPDPSKRTEVSEKYIPNAKEDTFRKKYVRAEITPANGDRLQSWMNLKRNKETGSCVFLDSSSSKCGIYDARPVQCRTHPFWPSLLEDEEAWKDKFVLPNDGIIEEGSGDRYWSAELGGCEGISIGNRNAVGTGIGQIINAVAKVPEADVKNVDMD